jgi:two-component system, NtrC family, sensor kinase
MKCPRCQQNNAAAQKFCGECGASLHRNSANVTPSHADIQRALTDALDQQTATAEILRVISQSTTDVQPVFEVIVETSCRLCEAVFANAVRSDGALMHNMAHHGFSPEAREMLLRAFPMAPTRESMSGRAILGSAVVQSEDMTTDDAATLSHQLSRLMGFRC